MSERQSGPERSGYDFLRALYQMINTVHMYQDNNQLVQASVGSFQDILNKLTGSGEINLILFRSRFHFGGEKLPYRRDAAVVVYNMADYFSKRDMGGMTFLESSRKALPEHLITLIRLLNEATRHENPYQWLEQKLLNQNFSWIQLSPRRDDDAAVDDGNPEEKRYEKARKNYFLAIAAVKEVATKVSQGMVGVRKTRRLAQNIVDMIREDANLMIGLTTLRSYDDYLYTHSVNVALLATCLGRHIDLSDIALEHLTICGLFHDLGKVDVPKEILLKHGTLTDKEWDLLKAHPFMGVKKILMLHTNPALRSRIILGPFEHHLNPDMTGYPGTEFMGRLSLLGKILHIADAYEGMTAERVYRPKAYTPNEALSKMWEEAGIRFDRILLKRFIHMMGIYPIGSVVELSDGSIGLVMDYPDEAERTLPLVLRLMNDGKGGWQRGEMIYLADRNTQNGQAHLNIIGGIQPSKLGINPVEYFLQVH